MAKRVYGVTLPIAGHAYIEVEAESEEEAKSLAFEGVSSKNIEDWEALETFTSGNVCHCPTPWRIEIEDHGRSRRVTALTARNQ